MSTATTTTTHPNNYPKLHNAAWPGLVGKGPDSEPPIELDKMVELTAAANVDGVKFDGMDLFLFDPHVSIDVDDDGIERIAEKFMARGLNIGSLVAPVWPPTGGGAAMGSDEDRRSSSRPSARPPGSARSIRQLGPPLRRRPDRLGVRPRRLVQDPEGTRRRSPRPGAGRRRGRGVRRALAAEGEICLGGMHSWGGMVSS
jgi:hypothetical protein